MTVHLIAITGGSGSGKTWLAEQLVAHFVPQAVRLALDDFYCDLSHLPLARRAEVNFDHPSSIDWPLFRQSLLAIRRGEPTSLPQYDFVTHTRRPAALSFAPRPLVILDGLWLLRRAEFRRLYRWSVFVDCPEALRLQRRCARDERERGRSRESIRAQFETHVAPMHRRFVATQAAQADFIVCPDTIGAGLAALISQCQALLTVPRSNAASGSAPRET